VAAPAWGGTAGTDDTVVLKTGLDVSLANKTAQLPLNASLNEVYAPTEAKKTLLSGRLGGVDKGRPFSIVHAHVATAKTTREATKIEGHANLTEATVHLPGLPLLGLIKVDERPRRPAPWARRPPPAPTSSVTSPCSAI
jgi:hypothetical protein